MVRESEAGYEAGCTALNCEHFPDLAVDLLVMLNVRRHVSPLHNTNGELIVEFCP